ncbi:MAG: hypothetical protein IKP93_03115 [Paludibacteraceae bacterium]|nr:hypothetical protein [Paludibacteraceae bacterium]
MKRLFSLLALAAMMCLPMQADSYRDLMSKYLSINDLSNNAQFEQVIDNVAATAFPNDQQAAECFSNYLSRQLTADMVEIYEPFFRRHVTEAELKELVDLYNDPKFADIQARAMDIVKNLDKSQEYMTFVGQYSEAIAKIMNDEKPREIQIADEVSREYADAFYAYYRGSGIDEVLMSAFQGIFQNLETQLSSVIANPQAVVKELNAYTSRNMPKILMAIYNKTLTLEDLRLLTSATDLPAYKHTMTAVAESASDPLALGLEVFRGMARWAEQQCPEYAAPLKEMIKTVEGMGK